MSLAPLQTVATTFRALLRQAADLALPPQCIACHKPLSTTGALCAACWASIDFIEAPYCAVSGLPLGTENIGGVRPEVAANPPPYTRARAAMSYSDASAPLILRFKYADRLEAASTYAGWMVRAGRDVLDGADLILPVPLHRWRLVARRYNQSAELARHLSRHAGVPFAPHLLARTRATRPQVGLSGDARRRNVAGAFRARPKAAARIAGKTIVLVDDVLTTGATIEACTQALLTAGAREVRVLTLARVVQGL